MQNPSFCQESIYMVKLASRSCQGTSRAITDSTKKSNSSARPMVPSSHNSRMLGSVSTSVKKQTVSRGHISGKKAHCSTSTLKARYFLSYLVKWNYKAFCSPTVSNWFFFLLEGNCLMSQVIWYLRRYLVSYYFVPGIHQTVFLLLHEKEEETMIKETKQNHTYK